MLRYSSPQLQDHCIEPSVIPKYVICLKVEGANINGLVRLGGFSCACLLDFPQSVWFPHHLHQCKSCTIWLWTVLSVCWLVFHIALFSAKLNKRHTCASSWWSPCLEENSSVLCSLTCRVHFISFMARFAKHISLSGILKLSSALYSSSWLMLSCHLEVKEKMLEICIGKGRASALQRIGDTKPSCWIWPYIYKKEEK